jgi:adenylate kinase family enzyme
MYGQRILILGCSGGGKTTLACRLGEITGLPVVHMDKLFWKPGWVKTPNDQFDPILTDALSRDAWIMDGNFGRTLPLRLDYCDAVIYLDYPRIVCLTGILTRVLKSYGRTRPDMGDDCPERFDWEFIKFTWNFEKIQGAKNKAILRARGKPVVWLRSRRAADKYLRALQRGAVPSETEK